MKKTKSIRILFLIAACLFLMINFQNCAKHVESVFTNKALDQQKLHQGSDSLADLIAKSEIFNKGSLTGNGKINLRGSADPLDMYNFKFQISREAQQSSMFQINLRSDALISQLALNDSIHLSTLENKLIKLKESIENLKLPLQLSWQQNNGIHTLQIGAYENEQFVSGMSLFFEFQPIDQNTYWVTLKDDLGASFFSQLKFSIK